MLAAPRRYLKWAALGRALCSCLKSLVPAALPPDVRRGFASPEPFVIAQILTIPLFVFLTLVISV